MSEPVGWRDVAKLIEDSERRVLSAIDDLKKRLDRQENRMDKQDEAIEDAEEKVRFFVHREAGARMVLGALVGTVFLIAAIIAAAKTLGAI